MSASKWCEREYILQRSKTMKAGCQTDEEEVKQQQRKKTMIDL